MHISTNYHLLSTRLKPLTKLAENQRRGKAATFNFEISRRLRYIWVSN